MTASTSGTYSWGLDGSQVLLEAFSRIELRPPAITGPHMVEARRSLNLALQSMANSGMPLLWAVDLITINLVAGVAVYSLPLNTADLLDVYVRLYSLTNTFNVPTLFTTTLNSTSVTVTVPNHGLVTGNFINVNTPVGIANILLSGYYQVTSVIDTNNFTIASPVAATSAVSGGGVVPEFTAIAGSSNYQVTLPNHGQTPNEYFNIAVSTLCGGNVLYGAYQVLSVSSSSVFTIATLADGIFNDSEYENGGQVQILAQAPSLQTPDYILTPLGRTDYADIPNKAAPGRPTSYWYDRVQAQTITMWQVPDNALVYQLQAYRMRRLQDANATMGELPDVPYRAFDALCGLVAVRLAMKYAKAMLPVVKADSDASWQALMNEDRERAQLMILPDLSGYYSN